MDKQPQDVSDRPRSALFAQGIGLLAVVLVAYPLSLGPAVFFYDVLHEPGWMARTFHVIYMPLKVVCESNSQLGRWMQAYADAARSAGDRFR